MAITGELCNPGFRYCTQWCIIYQCIISLSVFMQNMLIVAILDCFLWVFVRILWDMAPIIIMLLLLYPPNQTKYAILEKYLIWPLFVSIKYIFWREIRSVCTSVHALCLKKKAKWHNSLSYIEPVLCNCSFIGVI